MNTKALSQISTWLAPGRGSVSAGDLAPFVRFSLSTRACRAQPRGPQLA
jgi:hypothetical protein